MSVSPPRHEAFRIETRPDRGRVFVAPRGELDIATTPDLADELDRLVERGIRTIVIDLRCTTFIDSSGVHLLVRQTARPDAVISVIAGPKPVRRSSRSPAHGRPSAWSPRGEDRARPRRPGSLGAA